MKKKLLLTLMAGMVSTIAVSMTSLAGTWQQAGNDWTYIKDNNQYANNEFVIDNNHLYYIGPDYKMKTGFIPLNNAYYYFGPYGDMQTGWINDNNNWYYVSPFTCTMMADTDFTDSNGKTYHLNPDGTMAHNVIINGITYGSDGAAITGGSYAGNYYSYNNLVSSRYSTYDSSSDEDDDSDDTHSSSNTNSSSSTGSSYTDDKYDDYAEKILKLVNKERKRKGRSAVTLDPDLCEYANMRAEQIVDDFSHDYFTENNDLPDIAGTYNLAENIAKGQNTPEAVMNAWNKSSSHHEAIISKKYDRLGVGIHNENGVIYWVQIFAAD